MIVSDLIEIDENEIKLKFIKSSGPGGQNVNKISSAVQLSFNIDKSESISEEIKELLKKKLKSQINKNGCIVLSSEKFREQNLNRKDVLEKFKIIINQASKIPRKRIPTKPPMNSVLKRLYEKKLVGRLKNNRKNIKFDKSF